MGSLNIVSKASSILDAITDIILLYKASINGAITLTMILFITILAPYILSYSAGVQIFLHRKTFEKVELFTFKSLLLGLYLFPTGILYFILLDIVDVFLELYKWLGFSLLNKIKSEQQLVQIESNTAEYFGMSRMDWFSFKKQKLISQLFFETVPQAILQSLLFFEIIKGKDLAGITNNDLILSLSSAAFNSLLQIFKLYQESNAVKESFVQYSLNCITARFGWVPFEHQIKGFADNENIKTLTIDYKIKYRLPLITYLSENLTQNNQLKICDDANYAYNDYQEIQFDDEQKYKKLINNAKHQNKAALGSIEYDFSSISINKLITTIKEL